MAQGRSTERDHLGNALGEWRQPRKRRRTLRVPCPGFNPAQLPTNGPDFGGQTTRDFSVRHPLSVPEADGIE
jgi:hypothetical protein